PVVAAGGRVDRVVGTHHSAGTARPAAGQAAAAAGRVDPVVGTHHSAGTARPAAGQAAASADPAGPVAPCRHSAGTAHPAAAAAADRSPTGRRPTEATRRTTLAGTTKPNVGSRSRNQPQRSDYGNQNAKDQIEHGSTNTGSSRYFHIRARADHQQNAEQEQQ